MAVVVDNDIQTETEHQGNLYTEPAPDKCTITLNDTRKSAWHFVVRNKT